MVVSSYRVALPVPMTRAPHEAAPSATAMDTIRRGGAASRVADRNAIGARASQIHVEPEPCARFSHSYGPMNAGWRTSRTSIRGRTQVISHLAVGRAGLRTTTRGASAARAVWPTIAVSPQSSDAETTAAE